MLTQLASLLVAIIGVLAVPAIDTPSLMQKKNIELPQPELTAQSVFLIDTVEGSIFVNQKADQQRPIASITKLMSALVVLDSGINWSVPIEFEARDRRNGGIPYLIPGEKIMPMDAWRLMLIGSSNDAAALLARITAGSEKQFVDQMNKKAKELGLRYTVFTDPTGLHAGNISTAREVAAFARAALAIPRVHNAVQTRKFSFIPQGKEVRTVYSTNWLLGSSFSGAQIFGGKTGHIEESGYGLVSIAGNKKHELVGVVLGSESNEGRFNEMRELLKWGFKLIKL